MTRSTATKAAATLLLSVGTLALTACSNPSPSMHTLSQRSVDRGNTVAYTFDTDGRAIHQDIDSILHLNRPSRLHHNLKPY